MFRIHKQREVGSVLLDGSAGENGRGATRSDRIVNLGPCHFFKKNSVSHQGFSPL
jgi:hypothetical protein